MLLIKIHYFPELTTEIVRNERRNVGSAIEAHQVGHGCAGRSSFETLCLRYDPRCHKSAVAPAHYAQPFRICDAHFDDTINAGHQVLIVSEAPVFNVCAPELRAVTTRAARIRTQDRITVRSKSRKRVNTATADERLLEHAGWPAVNV